MERCGNDQFDEDAVTRLSTRGGVWGTAVVRGCFVSSGHQHVDVQDFGGLRCSELLLQYAAMANSSDRGPDISGWSNTMYGYIYLCYIGMVPGVNVSTNSIIVSFRILVIVINVPFLQLRGMHQI